MINLPGVKLLNWFFLFKQLSVANSSYATGRTLCLALAPCCVLSALSLHRSCWCCHTLWVHTHTQPLVWGHAKVCSNSFTELFIFRLLQAALLIPFYSSSIILLNSYKYNFWPRLCIILMYLRELKGNQRRERLTQNTFPYPMGRSLHTQL